MGRFIRPLAQLLSEIAALKFCGVLLHWWTPNTQWIWSYWWREISGRTLQEPGRLYQQGELGELNWDWCSRNWRKDTCLLLIILSVKGKSRNWQPKRKVREFLRVPSGEFKKARRLPSRKVKKAEDYQVGKLRIGWRLPSRKVKKALDYQVERDPKLDDLRSGDGWGGR